MKASEFETAGIIARTAELEMALIHQYLAGHPYDELTTTREEVRRIWREAVLYAALRLEEMKAKAQFVNTLRDQSASMM